MSEPSEPSASERATKRRERNVLLLLATIQFINILDFMMVMPLGPDFARDLGISTSHLGVIGGSYTAAAAVSGLVGALVLDRFDRKRALAVAMLGLAVGTAAGGLATGLGSLVLARVVAGAFGGPATSLSLSIIADLIPPERRGRAMAFVTAAFSAASVLGVPAGLELAARGGWRLPFFTVAAVGLVVTGAALWLMPTLTRPATASGQRLWAGFASLTKKPAPRLSLAACALMMMSGFLVIPNLSAYFQNNVHYPREHLGMLYMVGGSVAFVVTRFVGGLVDRFGSSRVAALGSLSFVGVVGLGLVDPRVHLPVMAFFIVFMITGSLRGVPLNTVASRVPAPEERGRYMSLQSAVQHLASALGAFLSSKMLSEGPGGVLVGMPRVALAAMALGALFPVLLHRVERLVGAPASPPASAPVKAP